MLKRGLIGSVVLATALCMSVSGAWAFDESKYPDLKGQWQRIGAPRWAKASEAPLTEEYKEFHAAMLAEQRTGGQGGDPTYTCLAPGMPRIMNVYDPMEIIITPETTYILIQHVHDSRRIFTDGRDFPTNAEPAFAGYSIGKWIDADGDGRFDTLEVETRNFKGPRAFEPSGMPLHKDNQTIVKERIYLDKANKDLLHNEITIIDHAFTRPWTVMKNSVRDRVNDKWYEDNCAENNNHIIIGKERYFRSADGHLMPLRKDQPPPDLRKFTQPR